MGVGLILTEWNGVNRSFFDEFAVSSVAGAIAMLTKNHEAFLSYQFFVDGVYPAFKWDADWPLWRRRDSTLVERQLVQGAQPWSVTGTERSSTFAANPCGGGRDACTYGSAGARTRPRLILGKSAQNRCDTFTGNRHRP